MPERIKAYLYAAASILDIWPSTNYLDLVAKESDQDAISGDVHRVAKDMKVVLHHEIQESEYRSTV